MSNLDVLILGCGFTGTRLARRLLREGARVWATARDPRKLAGLGVEPVELHDIPARMPPRALVVHSVPPEGSVGLVGLLGGKPARVVYLSSTGVYGAAAVVDEHTPVDPAEPRAAPRIEAENEVLRGPWPALVLRPAAIYGPGRGVQERIRRGDFHASDQIVSRIHVDDLVTHIVAALQSPIIGAFPVADEHPSSSREAGEFAARLMRLPLASDGASPSQRSDGGTPSQRKTGNRSVDGSAIRGLLGIALRYPSYREGIAAALSEA